MEVKKSLNQSKARITLVSAFFWNGNEAELLRRIIFIKNQALPSKQLTMNRFEIHLAYETEGALEELVRGVKGVRLFRRETDPELGCYRISFGYQRREPLKFYLLILDPEQEILTLTAREGVGIPPENVRQRLLQRLGHENYSETANRWACNWEGVSLESLNALERARFETN